MRTLTMAGLSLLVFSLLVLCDATVDGQSSRKATTHRLEATPATVAYG